ncbi:GspH/FimT family pseudopilin [Thiocapsa bogorovii]|uniref:GspH/FimT family pseudopilin n=1 Tax=Thiocapsa bogorovii TaxID=521689 RepID=UPI001E595DAB|nr:GspH/FimT family pseudopilin [Thiocapsa bogorovii]UHD16158.1 GspH/FimT family pseudopilin [Thiocapsa bogorovii]
MRKRHTAFCGLIAGAPPRQCAGFTLLELMIAVTILVILTGIGVPSFSNFVASQRTIAAAGDFQMALWRTRSEAIRLNRDVTLSPTDAEIGWESGWVANDPSDDDHALIHGDALDGVMISGGPDSIIYRASGRLRGSSIAGIEFASKTSRSADKRCIGVDLSGQPTLMRTGCP